MDSPGKNTGVGCHFLLHCEVIRTIKKFQTKNPNKVPQMLAVISLDGKIIAIWLF